MTESTCGVYPLRVRRRLGLQRDSYSRGRHRTAQRRNESRRNMSQVVSERGTGGATFAAVLMIIGGGLGLLEGISLVAGATFYVQPANYWISTGAATWGWLHIVVSLVV